MRSRITLLAGFLALLVIAGCAVASEGGASEPVVSNVAPTTEIGALSVGAGLVNFDTCEGVLGSGPESHALETRSHTLTVSSIHPDDVVGMCSATLQQVMPGAPFLSVVAIEFASDELAVERLAGIREGAVEEGLHYSEVDSSDPSLIDHVSVLSNSDGIGRISAFRQHSYVVSVTVGPSTEASLWSVGDMERIALSVLERAE